MRILLNTLLPSEEELELFAAMGFDVKNIENQYYKRNYFVETFDPAFTERVENTGTGFTKTISFHGIDVMYVYKYSLFNESNFTFEMDMVGVEHALVKVASMMMSKSWQIASEDIAPALKAGRFQAF